MGVYIEEVQKWLNKTYVGRDGFVPIQENGETGWETTNALLVAFQMEIGISKNTIETEISTGLYSFGQETMNACPNISASTDLDTQNLKNISMILQGAFWCKGIDPGVFGPGLPAGLTTAINTLQEMAGIAQTGVAGYLEFRALLSMDAFEAIYGGDPNVVAIQRAINGKYAYQMQQLIPCDGIIDRTMQSALLFVLEMLDEFPAWACRYALMPSNFGYFAPNLLTATPTINMGDSSPYSLLLQQTLYCNGYTDILFTGVYDQQTSVCVEAFKSEMVLGGGTAVDGETWESLLTSHGYSGRPARACDTAQTITLAQAQALKESGYVIIGRYLTDKFAMTSDEISDILAGGLSIFPIFETYGTYSSYFTTAQGITDATQAVNAAQGLGIPEGTIIYFGVDCDILDNDVTETVIPYFEGINNQFEVMGSSYKVGVYGSRNICTQTYKAGLTVTSFVLDMSTGYSGNIMNFSMPENWAFNQFATISIDGVGIDKDGYSGRDTGFNTVDTGIIYQSLYNEVLKELNFKFIETSAGTVVSKVITSTEPEATVCVLAEVQVSADIGNTKGIIQIVNGNPKLSVSLPEGVNLTFGEQGLASISKTIGNGDVSFGINKSGQVFIKIKTSEKFGSNESVADTLVLTVYLDPNYINPDEMPGAPELSPVQSVEWQTAVQKIIDIYENSGDVGKVVIIGISIVGVVGLLVGAPETIGLAFGAVVATS